VFQRLRRLGHYSWSTGSLLRVKTSIWQTIRRNLTRDRLQSTLVGWDNLRNNAARGIARCNGLHKYYGHCPRRYLRSNHASCSWARHVTNSVYDNGVAEGSRVSDPGEGGMRLSMHTCVHSNHHASRGIRRTLVFAVLLRISMICAAETVCGDTARQCHLFREQLYMTSS